MDWITDRIAIEVQQHHTGGEERALAGALVQLSRDAHVPWVVTNDPRYLDGESRLREFLLVEDPGQVRRVAAAVCDRPCNPESRAAGHRPPHLAGEGATDGSDAGIAPAFVAAARQHLDRRCASPPVGRRDVADRQEGLRPPDVACEHLHARPTYPRTEEDQATKGVATPRRPCPLSDETQVWTGGACAHGGGMR